MAEKIVPTGRLVSVNVGLSRAVEWKNKSVTTGIFKKPVKGRIALRRLNLDGDQQADLTVHGGPDMAVYVYPAEHYEYWRTELVGEPLPWGMFGENFSTQGLLEESVNVGDQFRVGSAELQVTQPRMPCYKLALRFERDDMIKRFMASRRTGFYFRVLQEGQVQQGDSIDVVSRDKNEITIADITRLYIREDRTADLLQRVIDLEPLPASWREYFQDRQKKN